MLELERVELAFVAALQHLPATQRAALILCEVLELSAAEAAELLATSVASITSALQRARASVAERIPARSQQATLRELGEPAQRELVRAFVDAWHRSDADAIVALLAQDARFSMPRSRYGSRAPPTSGGSSPSVYSRPRGASCRSGRAASSRSRVTRVRRSRPARSAWSRCAGARSPR